MLPRYRHGHRATAASVGPVAAFDGDFADLVGDVERLSDPRERLLVGVVVGEDVFGEDVAVRRQLGVEDVGELLLGGVTAVVGTRGGLA